MGTEQEHKSTRFSRWRERRRVKALRDSELKRELKGERTKRDQQRDWAGRGGDGPGGGGGFAAGM